jgi:hypothetical protein
VNTAGSWDNRPAAQTAFRNLVIAGDYVRTFTDFASMESANEAAKRAVNVILARDEAAGAAPLQRCTITALPVPRELRGPIRLVSAVDNVAVHIGFPHPLMFLASPIGWFAGFERILRSCSLRLQGVEEGPRARPARPAQPRADADLEVELDIQLDRDSDDWPEVANV